MSLQGYHDVRGLVSKGAVAEAQHPKSDPAWSSTSKGSDDEFERISGCLDRETTNQHIIEGKNIYMYGKSNVIKQFQNLLGLSLISSMICSMGSLDSCVPDTNGVGQALSLGGSIQYH